MGFYPVSDTYSALSFVTFGEFSSLNLSFLFKSGKSYGSYYLLGFEEKREIQEIA